MISERIIAKQKMRSKIALTSEQLVVLDELAEVLKKCRELKIALMCEGEHGYLRAYNKQTAHLSCRCNEGYMVEELTESITLDDCGIDAWACFDGCDFVVKDNDK